MSSCASYVSRTHDVFDDVTKPQSRSNDKRIDKSFKGVCKDADDLFASPITTDYIMMLWDLHVTQWYHSVLGIKNTIHRAICTFPVVIGIGTHFWKILIDIYVVISSSTRTHSFTFDGGGSAWFYIQMHTILTLISIVYGISYLN